MTHKVEILFGEPQREIATILSDLLQKCWRASMISGFASVEGVKLIAPAILRDPAKLNCFVVGAATQQAFDALDHLIECGVPADRLYIHLGHTRSTGNKAKYRFYRYHPMLHSKVYLFDMPNQRSIAIIGSHNVTGFALGGLNAEAAVRVETDEKEDPELERVRAHIESCRKQATPYHPALKDAYTWWFTQFLDGLKQKVADRSRDDEGKHTVVIICTSQKIPSSGDVIYFEIPSVLRQRALDAEVHVYVFDTLPPTPLEALRILPRAKASLWAKTLGLEDERGGLELQADWQILGGANPELKRTSKPFRPNVAHGMQQVRVKVYKEVFGQYEYLFDTRKTTWVPEYDESQSIRLSAPHKETISSLDLVPPEHLDWHLVRGLKRTEGAREDFTSAALRQTAPESGNYILLSLRRIPLKGKDSSE